VGLEGGNALLAVAGGHHGLSHRAYTAGTGSGCDGRLLLAFVVLVEQELELELEPAHSGLEQLLRLDEAVAALGVGVGGVGGEEEHGSVEFGGGAQEVLGLLRVTGGVAEDEGA